MLMTVGRDLDAPKIGGKGIGQNFVGLRRFGFVAWFISG
jgi:hypothetical protein